METLVATSIIIIVFVVASLVLNNTFKNLAQKDSFSIENRMEELRYLVEQEQLNVPYQENFNREMIELFKEIDSGVSFLIIEVTSRNNLKQKYILEN